MNKEYPNITAKVFAALEELKREIPEPITSFANLSKTALQEGSLTKQTKELIALAIAIILNSDDCIAYHLTLLVQQGLTYDELLELTAVVTYLGGGPALMAATNALASYRKIAEQKHDNIPSQPSETDLQKSDATQGYG